MAQVKFYRGERASYNPGTHADGIYFATDTAEILLNNVSYGLSQDQKDQLITDITYDAASGTLTFVTSGEEEEDITIQIPNATGTTPGLMSAADKAKLDAVLAGMDDTPITEQIQNAVDEAKATIDAYTVNSKAISTNPVLNGADIKLDGYQKPNEGTTAVAATDTVNQAIGKLEDANTNTQQALEDFIGTKNTPNGFAGLDENGKIDPSLVDGVVGHVLGLEQFVESTALPTADATNVGKYYFVTDTNKIAECVENEGAYSWEYTDPQPQVLYNRRGQDENQHANTLYRWDGEAMVPVSDPIAIGTVTGTAYDGAQGQANRLALNALPNTVVTGFGAVTPTADELTIAFTDSDKSGENNQYSTGDGGNITIPAATNDTAGLMPAEDKTYITNIKNIFGEDASSVANLDILQKSNAGIGVLADYTGAAVTAEDVAANDTITTAISKLQKQIDDISGDGTGSIADQIEQAITDLIGGASEEYNTLKELEDAIKAVDNKVGTPADDDPETPATGLFLELDNLEARVAANEAAIAIINGEDTVEGSIKKAAADTLASAKAYTDGALTWVEV